ATPQSNPLSLHDALPISDVENVGRTLTEEAIRVVTGETSDRVTRATVWRSPSWDSDPGPSPVRPFAQRLLQQAYARVPRAVLQRSEEHTSELQSPDHLVC